MQIIHASSALNILPVVSSELVSSLEREEKEAGNLQCFHCQVLEDQNAARYERMSLEQYLNLNAYSTAFRLHYLLPMCAAVWSSPNRKARFATKLLLFIAMAFLIACILSQLSFPSETVLHSSGQRCCQNAKRSLYYKNVQAEISL